MFRLISAKVGSIVMIAVGFALTSPIMAETQTFQLAPFWNLITFQVIPDDPTPESVFSTLPGFQSAWTYDSESALWRQYIKPSGLQIDNQVAANNVNRMPDISPGQAYWVFVSQSVSAWEVTGTVPQGDAFPGVPLNEGWNLFGVPTGTTDVEGLEPVSLLQVLTTAGLDYDALMTWESQSYRKMFRPQEIPDEDPPNPLAGLPPESPFPIFDPQEDLGRGYWIHVTDPAILRPRLVTTVRSDFDAEPFENFPSKEDVNVSGVETAAEPTPQDQQDIIRFFPGEDVQTLGISNLGQLNTGGGILIWEAEWKPTTDLDTPEPWIRLFTSPAEREERDQDGNLLSPYTSLKGVTTLENDIVYLRLDRRNLGRGVHEGTLNLRTSVGNRTYRVVAEVGGLEGDYKGFAVINSVNGLRNPVPDVDLVISFYEDNKVDGLLRGIVDSSQALLWPVDVPLIGYRVAEEGNRFVIGGSFVMPPGDQNGEPYDQFDENEDTAGVDVDWNNDGLLDVDNPFPFPIQRTLFLDGTLVLANPTDGYFLEGKYQEIVHGMSKDPIILQGEFELQRINPRPFATRRLSGSDTGTEPVVVISNGIDATVASGATASSAISVLTEMELQALQVNLNFLTPLPHSNFSLILRPPGPNAAELILYDGRDEADAINPKVLESITFPLDRPTQGDLIPFLQSVERTQTDGSQFWELEITNSGSSTITLDSWSLRLEGQPVTSATGLVKSGEDPLEGVKVTITGLPISQSSEPTDAEGRFTISRVPFLPLNFSAIRPGYIPDNPGVPGLSNNFTSPFFNQEGLSEREQAIISNFNPLAGAPVNQAGVSGFDAGTEAIPFELNLKLENPEQQTIAAGPLIVDVGSTIDFFALAPSENSTWDFGDGNSSTESNSNHAYSVPGFYRALLSPEGEGETNSVEVIVRQTLGSTTTNPAGLGGEPSGLDPVAAEASYAAYLFQSSFSMAGVIPARKSGTDPDTGADRYVSDLTPTLVFQPGETNELGAAYVSSLPIQHAYAASMDIDLAPQVGSGSESAPYDEDGFEPLTTPGFDPSINSNSQGFKEEDFNYALVADLWQNTRDSEGEVEYNQDAQNGLIVWGNGLTNPNLNYATGSFEAKDGANYTVASDDTTFHPQNGTNTFSDLDTNQEVAHYQMACSIGSLILNIPDLTSAVSLAKTSRNRPDDPLQPELAAANKPESRNLHFQLQTGILDLD